MSPLRSSDDDDDPDGVDVRTAEVDAAVVPQRHATATVSIHGLSGPDRTYPEYMLRPLTERHRAPSRIRGRIWTLFGRDDGHVLEDLDGPRGIEAPTMPPQMAMAGPRSYIFGFSPQPSTRGEPESEPQLSAGRVNGGDGYDSVIEV